MRFSRPSISPEAAFIGLVAAFVGYASSFALVLEGLRAVGASPAELASGLFALSIGMGLCGVLVSLVTKMPISIAWSTPGAALLASTGAVQDGFAGAVGAFLLCGLLFILAGFWQSLGRLVASIPKSLANAMLAGVLLHLCLAPALALKTHPIAGLAIIAVWALVARLKRLYAVPAAVALTIALIALLPTDTNGTASLPHGWQSLAPQLMFIAPRFSVQNAIGVALPLFLVTMASQNIPGLAVLAMNGYRPHNGALFMVTGIFTLLCAPFGGHAINLAAITAAMCAGPEAGEDKTRRFGSAMVAGAAYMVIGLFATAITQFVSLSPPVLMEAAAGLALLNSFGLALREAMREEAEREAALVTFLVAASGVAFFGIGSAFWGLIAGGALLGLARMKI